MYVEYLKKNLDYKVEVDTTSKQYQEFSRNYYESFFTKYPKREANNGG